MGHPARQCCGVGHSCWDTLVGLVWDTLVGHFVEEKSCETLLWDIDVGHSCRTLLWDTLAVGHSCATLLYVTLVGHSCRTLSSDTLLSDTLAEHSFGTPVGDSGATLLYDTLKSCGTHLRNALVGQSCGHPCRTRRALLPDTLVEHFCGTLLLDTLVCHA